MTQQTSRNTLNIHQNTIDYSYIVDVNNVRLIDCVLMNVKYEKFTNQMNLFTNIKEPIFFSWARHSSETDGLIRLKRQLRHYSYRFNFDSMTRKLCEAICPFKVYNTRSCVYHLYGTYTRWKKTQKRQT